MMQSGTSTIATTTEHDSIDTMSFLTIYNCHNGDLVKIPKPIRYHTLQDFKQFICESFTNYLIGSNENVFLLTSFGIKLNFSIINELNEVYVFDKRIFNKNSDLLEDYFKVNLGSYNNLVVEFEQLNLTPMLSDSPKNIKSMSLNLKSFQNFCNNYLHHIIKTNELISANFLKQINNIFKSLNTIFQFINNFVNDIEKSFNSYYNYVKLINFKSLQKNWATYYQSLKKFPVIKIKDKSFSLVDFLDYNLLTRNSKFIGDNLPEILKKFNEMIQTINSINNEKVSIDKVIENKRNESIELFKSNNLDSHIQKTKTLVNQVIKLLGNSDNNDLSSIYSECQTCYTELLRSGDWINKMLLLTKDFKHDLVETSYSILNRISALQMEVVNVKNDLKLLSQPSQSKDLLSFETVSRIKKAEDYLSLTIDLPLLFGFILIEQRRQYEWYDFFSKGVVQNITEQLMTIIENEKVFQKLWIKKFGTFLNLLNNNLILKAQFPNLDITLINNKDQNEMFKILDGIDIGRDDILDYITKVEGFEVKSKATGEELDKKFTNLLNKNFKDLVKSTNNMKTVTKLVTSIGNMTSPNEDLSNSKIKKLIENDSEFNDNLVKGLKTRIRKLEDLLHQQQFKNLSNWPVTRGYTPPREGSTPISTPPPQSQIQYPKHSNTLSRTASIKTPSQKPENNNIVSSPRLNPTSLLRKNSSSTPMDASVTIDKHLDNIRLRKENKELVDENTRLKQSNFNKDMEIEKLLLKIQHLEGDRDIKEKTNNDMLNTLKSEHLKETSKFKEKIKEEITELKEQISNNKSIITEYRSINDNKEKTIRELGRKLELKAQEIEDLAKLKEDLMSNMAAKELEYNSQVKGYEDDIKQLSTKLEEQVEEYEHLIEITHQKNNTGLLKELNHVIESLMMDIKSSITVNYEFFIELVMILESIGLLLVKEYNKELGVDEFKITRVKGLRSKKSEEGDISFISIDDKPTTKVIGDIDQSMKWIYEVKADPFLESAEDIKSIPTDFEDQQQDEDEASNQQAILIQKSNELIKLYNNFFKTEDESKFSKFLKLISFKNEELDKFFLTAISKRFRDVEGFAKKLTKENKVKVQDISKLNRLMNSKISMNHFAMGDLALFLPTRIENTSKVNVSVQPWAAFNIGAPHYFLNNINDRTEHLSNKEWLVAKITNIKEQVITTDNFEDEKANPFKLSVGITWFLVDAKEEVIS